MGIRSITYGVTGRGGEPHFYDWFEKGLFTGSGTDPRPKQKKIEKWKNIIKSNSRSSIIMIIIVIAME
jgi:hypothetical protein